MKPADGKIRFTEWLPDLPDLDNPGLIEAHNVHFVDGAYRPFRPLSTSTTYAALTTKPLGGIVLEDFTFVGTGDSLKKSVNALGSWTDVSSASQATTTAPWQFARFDDWIIAANLDNTPYRATTGGSFTTLASTGTAPKAKVVGKIGRFIFLGHTNDGTDTVEYRVQWCAIDEPTKWPTPGSSTAQSLQAGEQFLNPEWGAVQAILGADQFGLIFQEGGITRASYHGGDTVFQFDEISNDGLAFARGIVQAGRLWFYISKAGIFVTNGVESTPVGVNKVDRYFWDNFWAGTSDQVHAAVDVNRKVIYWAYQAELVSSGTKATEILAYNYEAQKFSRCSQELTLLLSDPQADPTTNLSFVAFDTSFVGKRFTGSAGTAKLTTGEFELNPGARTFVQGIKPLVSWPTGVTVNETVALGTRNDQDADNVTFTSESTPNARTRFAGFRSDARYHRARLTLTGSFDEAMGLEIQAVPSGST